MYVKVTEEFIVREWKNCITLQCWSRYNWTDWNVDKRLFTRIYYVLWKLWKTARSTEEGLVKTRARSCCRTSSITSKVTATSLLDDAIEEAKKMFRYIFLSSGSAVLSKTLVTGSAVPISRKRASIGIQIIHEYVIIINPIFTTGD